MKRKSLTRGAVAGMAAIAFATFAPSPTGAEPVGSLDWHEGTCSANTLCIYEEIWGDGRSKTWVRADGRIGLNYTPWENRVKSFISYTTGYFLDAGTRSCRRFDQATTADDTTSTSA